MFHFRFAITVLTVFIVLFTACTDDSSGTGLRVGDPYQGGVIAYIFKSGDPGYVAGETHGLVAAIYDQGSAIPWASPAVYSEGGTPFSVTGTSPFIGTGAANTDLIIASNGSGSAYAAGLARACADGGYNDWYLPSKNELNELYNNRTAIGSFSTGSSDRYWSSSELSAGRAWTQRFGDGFPDDYDTFRSYRVRAVRSF